jgi:hypothetical protein
MNPAQFPSYVACCVDELRPHPSLLKHQVPVSAFKLSALDQLGELAFRDPVIVTRDRIVVDGYARLELAKSRDRLTIDCLEYAFTEDEALCYFLQKQRRSNGLNDFSRIELALDLESCFRERARSNQQDGGRAKGSSMLTAADRVDSRKEIAQIAGVSVGNVTKVKRILSYACSLIHHAARSGEISINLAEWWSHQSADQQAENLRRRRLERGIKKKARELVMAQRRKLLQRESDKLPLDFPDLLRLVTRLASMSATESNELGPVTMASVNVPGKIIFVTQELLNSFKPQQEVLVK